MAGTLEQERRALFEIGIVLALALGAIVGALVIATSLPYVTILIGAAAVYAVAFVVIALTV